MTLGGTTLLLQGSVPVVSGSPSPWSLVSGTFVAPFNTGTLQIIDGYMINGTNSNYSPSSTYDDDINIANFSLICISTVPEPKTYAAAFLLVGMIGWFERKRLKKLVLLGTAGE